MDKKIITGPPAPSLPPKDPKVVIPVVQTSVAVAANKEEIAPVSDDIVIHTMQDDLQAIKDGKKVTLPSKAPSVPGVIKAEIKLPVQSTDSLSTQKNLPLPPKTSADAAKQRVVLVPQVAKRHGIWRVITAVIVVFLILGGIGGAGVWWWFYGRTTINTDNQNSIANASDVLPSDASLIIQYKLTSADSRTSVLSAWNKRSDESSMTSLLRGDPRLLLQDPSVNEFYYVLLSNEPRPFLVIPKTENTKTLLSGNSDARTSEKSGWYIAHSVSTDSYISDLNQKNLTSVGSDTILTTSPEQAPIRIIVGPGSLMKWREALSGTSFANGQLQELSFAGRFAANGTGLELSGLAVPLRQPSTGQSNQQLLSQVPPTAKLVRLGASFSDDLSVWAKTASLLDPEALAQPNVQTLLGQLNTPYVFFVNSDGQGKHSYGLVISLPSNLSPSLQAGDAAVESGLTALVPLLTGKQSLVPLAFSTGSRGNRYVNLTGTVSSLDYNVNGQYLEVATSKDTMFGMLDALESSSEDASITSGANYSHLLSLWGVLPNSRDIVLGTMDSSLFKDLFPIDPNTSEFSFGLSLQPADDGKNLTLQGVIQLASPDNSDVQTSPQPITSPEAGLNEVPVVMQ